MGLHLNSKGTPPHILVTKLLYTCVKVCMGCVKPHLQTPLNHLTSFCFPRQTRADIAEYAPPAHEITRSALFFCPQSGPARRRCIAWVATEGPPARGMAGEEQYERYLASRRQLLAEQVDTKAQSLASHGRGLWERCDGQHRCVFSLRPFPVCAILGDM